MTTTIGFIGTGTIAEAVIAGLRLGGGGPDIVVSPRSAARSLALAGRFERVTRAESNAEVAAAADIVCLSMLPTRVEEALAGVELGADRIVVSFVAGLTLDALRQLAPAARICRVVPLPMIARREGPILCYPPLPEITALFGDLGTLVVPDSEDEFQALMAVSGFMSSYFALQGALAGWLETQGADGARSSRFVRALFAALGTTALETPAAAVAGLVAEHETPGGLNFRTRRWLAENGWLEAPGTAFDEVLALKRAALE